VQPKRQSRRLSGASVIVDTWPDAPAPPLPSNGLQRSDTSMSARSQAGTSIAVKKARLVNPAKKDASKVPRVQKKTTAAPSAKPVTSSGTSVQPESKHEGASNKAEDDMDKITSGMKKIKINLITKSQKDVRERAEAGKKAPSPGEEEEKQALHAAEVAEARMEDSGDVSPTQVDPHDIGGGLATPVQESAYSAFSPDPRQVALPASSPVLSPTQNGPATADMFIPYQPEGHEPVAIAQQGQLKWLPPNTGTPTPMKRADLPVFTALSAIPFAPSPARKLEPLPNGQPQGVVKSESTAEPSIWEVPETP
jgi:histone deacetylase HOS3